MNSSGGICQAQSNLPKALALMILDHSVPWLGWTQRWISHPPHVSFVFLRCPYPLTASLFRRFIATGKVSVAGGFLKLLSEHFSARPVHMGKNRNAASACLNTVSFLCTRKKFTIGHDQGGWLRVFWILLMTFYV